MLSLTAGLESAPALRIGERGVVADGLAVEIEDEAGDETADEAGLGGEEGVIQYLWMEVSILSVTAVKLRFVAYGKPIFIAVSFW